MKKENFKINTIILFGLILGIFSIVSRLIPHMPNFAPIAAFALFAGAYMPKKTGLLLLLSIMIISDVFIGFYDLRLMAAVYLSFLAISVIGWVVKKDKNASSVVLGSLSGSVVFYLITNYAVWAFSSWYPHSLNGLLSSYAMGLLFLKSSLAGDLFYTSVFFVSYEIFARLEKGRVVNFLKQAKVSLFKI
jgi:hypothetical protein